MTTRELLFSTIIASDTMTTFDSRLVLFRTESGMYFLLEESDGHEIITPKTIRSAYEWIAHHEDDPKFIKGDVSFLIQDYVKHHAEIVDGYIREHLKKEE